MKNDFHFISGLPRSGSTLLSALLQQNPRFQAGMISPVASLCQRLIVGMGPQNEFSLLIDADKRRAILRALFDGYYKDIDEQKTVFDSNRMWCARLPLIAELFPEARVIACVRQLSWIVDSFERLFQRNPLVISKIIPVRANATVFSRAANLVSSEGVIGFAWNGLQEAFFGEFAHKLVLIDYEALTRDPTGAMKFLYGELNMPFFQHDFSNVAFDQNEEFDGQIGAPSLHSVGKTVRYEERMSILPPELINRYTGSSFWRKPGANARGVKMFLPPRMNPGPNAFR